MKTLVCLILLSPAFLWSASFDCPKARTKLEKTICADPKLSAADDELNAAWRAALKTFPVPAALRTAQKYWLQGARECPGRPAPGDCLTVFSERATFLKDLSGAKVYTKYGKQFSIEEVTLAFFTRDGKAFLWTFGNWMPDMIRQQPPPDGWLMDDIMGLKHTSGSTYQVANTDDDGKPYEISITEDRIRFGLDGEPLMVSSRQAPLDGDYHRVR